LSNSLLQLENLSVSFAIEEHGRVTVVDDVSFSIGAGRSLGLVGESGCGKSVTAMSIMRLLPSPPSHVERGRILFENQDLLTLPETTMRRIRGDRIGMIFQEPMTSLNPVFSLGFQLTEVLRIHRRQYGRSAERAAIDMLQRVGIGAAQQRLQQFPHELSGGLRQRVMIAMALLCGPQLLIADEPTTALDVTIQAQILDLIKQLQREFGMALLMITHDLGVVTRMCEQVIVMYAGRVVEQAPTRALFKHPQHPYTAGLLNSIPRLGRKQDKLPTIAGIVPNPENRAGGCHFAARCQRVMARCRAETPVLDAPADTHAAACWNPLA
jgi:oligopeptide/dipeptide ABC transporter ATP-binding protein